MKKFTLLAFISLWGITAHSQSLDFIHNGNVVTTDKVYINEGFDDLGMMYAEINVKNQGATEVEATLTITANEVVNGSINYCGFGLGACVPVEVNRPSARTTTIAPGKDVESGVDFISLDRNGTAKATFTLTSGSMTKSIEVYFNIPDAINSALVNNLVTISQRGNVAELNYNFDTTANRTINVYNVTGSKILADNLSGNNGTVSLSLEKGIYIYSVVENGKVIATHKFVVR